MPEACPLRRCLREMKVEALSAPRAPGRVSTGPAWRPRTPEWVSADGSRLAQSCSLSELLPAGPQLWASVLVSAVSSFGRHQAKLVGRNPPCSISERPQHLIPRLAV